MNWGTLCPALAAALTVLAWEGAADRSTVAAAPRPLSLSLSAAAGNPIKDAIDAWRRDVERRTDGAVTIAITAERQYEDEEVISAVSSGAVDIGATSLNQFAFDVPIAGVFLQPFMFNYDALVRAAARPGGEIRSLVDDEIRYWTTTHVLLWLPHGSAVMFSRGAPGLDPAAIANRHVGAPDDQTKELTKACGGTAHLVPPSDLYDALENNNIQITMADIFSVTERNLWRVTDTIVNTKHSPSLFIVIINDAVWGNLSADHQRVLTEASEALQERSFDAVANIEAQAYAFAATKGMKVYDPSPRDVVAWRQCSAPLLESYVDRIGELGPRLFTAYGRLRTDPCCNDPMAGQTPPELR